MLAAGCAATAAPAGADILYNITTFDGNDAASQSTNLVQYDPGLVSINLAPGVAGPTASQLATLQTLNPNATTGTSGSRFQNTDLDPAQTDGTLISDASTTLYFQFGITPTEAGKGFNIDSLQFLAKKSTASVSTRGYSVQVSTNGGSFTTTGGTYALLGAANVSADRNNAGFDLVTLNTPGAPYQNLTSINFRVFSTGGGIEYTNMAINGTIVTLPVPEPGSLALIGLLAPLALRRRARAGC